MFCTLDVATNEEVDSLARAFKALSHPNRLAIYMEVMKQSETALKSCGLAELIDRLDIGAPTISHHTKELVQARLIHVEKDGKFLRCRLNPIMQKKIADFFA